MTRQIKWVVAVVLALLTAGAAWLWTEQYRSQLTSAQFLRLRDGVSLVADKTVVKDDMITVVNLPQQFASGLDVVAIPVSGRPALVGSRPLQDVRAGSLLLKQYFAPEEIRDLADWVPSSKRALSITVNAESTVGYFVRPGSRVDVIGTFATPQAGGSLGTGRETLETRVLVEDIGILAVGPARNFPEYQRIADRGYGTVTLEVTPEQASTIILAQQQVSGPLTLLLRGAKPDAEAPAKDAAETPASAAPADTAK